METNLEERKPNDDEEIEVFDKFESIFKCSMNEITCSMFQLFSAHDMIVGGMKNIDKDFVKRAILAEKDVLSNDMFYILETMTTYYFSDNQKEILRGIANQEQAMINIFDEEYKKIV